MNKLITNLKLILKKERVKTRNNLKTQNENLIQYILLRIISVLSLFCKRAKQIKINTIADPIHLIAFLIHLLT